MTYMVDLAISMSKKRLTLVKVFHILEGLGMQFFLIKLEGIQIEMNLLSFLTLKNGSSYMGQILGYILGLILIPYFTVIMIK